MSGFYKLRPGRPRRRRGGRPRRHRAHRRRAARAGQPLVHALRSLGPGEGRHRRRGAAERGQAGRGLPRRAAGRLVLRADQLPAVGAGDRLHPHGLRREGDRRRTSASPTVVAAAADEAGVPAEARLAHGSVPGFRDVEAALAEQPDTLPDDRAAGAAMHYTSGTTGKPKGVKRKLTDVRPRRHGRAVHRLLRPVRHPATATATCTSARRRTTTPRSPRSRATRCNSGTPVVFMDKWDPEETLRQDRALPVHAHAHGADAVPPDAAAARRGEGEVRRVVDAVGDPRRRAVPGRRQAKMLDWWGPVIWEYYGATEGGGTTRHPGGLAEVPRHRRQRRGRSPS